MAKVYTVCKHGIRGGVMEYKGTLDELKEVFSASLIGKSAKSIKGLVKSVNEDYDERHWGYNRPWLELVK